ncbi:ScbR family autoregulator-binding transcription factor [Streptomyces sp. NPDC005244]|uniref:ScbR family autoregulator-binding transcription factor n=1 Tax=Streptomyces sp. NPDC005244 TaxID=3364708 RepID=UPI0036916D83
MVTKSGRVQQARATRTREVLLHTAAEVFDEFGYAGANITTIMKRAGLTPGAMYFHFDSKEDLARAVMLSQPGTITPHLRSQGLQRLVDITLVWSRQLQVNVLLRAGVRLTGEQNQFGSLDPSPYREWAGIMEQCLLSARELGQLREGADTHEIADFLVSACTGMQMYSWVASNRRDLSKRTVQMWNILLPAVAAAHVAPDIKLSTRRASALAR